MTNNTFGAPSACPLSTQVLPLAVESELPTPGTLGVYYCGSTHVLGLRHLIRISSSNCPGPASLPGETGRVLGPRIIRRDIEDGE